MIAPASAGAERNGILGTFLVSAGAAVITPQRRFIRAPQGSPKSLGGREEVSLSPHVVTALRSATFGFQACVDRSGQLVHHLLGLSFLAARLIRSYMGYVPEMPSIQLSMYQRRGRIVLLIVVKKTAIFWPRKLNFFNFFARCFKPPMQSSRPRVPPPGFRLALIAQDSRFITSLACPSWRRA